MIRYALLAAMLVAGCASMPAAERISAEPARWSETGSNYQYWREQFGPFANVDQQRHKAGCTLPSLGPPVRASTLVGCRGPRW